VVEDDGPLLRVDVGMLDAMLASVLPELGRWTAAEVGRLGKALRKLEHGLAGEGVGELLAMQHESAVSAAELQVYDTHSYRHREPVTCIAETLLGRCEQGSDGMPAWRAISALLRVAAQQPSGAVVRLCPLVPTLWAQGLVEAVARRAAAGEQACTIWYVAVLLDLQQGMSRLSCKH
jgi:hypothetical protein